MFLFSTEKISAQNIKNDLMAINKTYHAIEKMSLKMDLKMFENYYTSNVYYSQSGTIVKNGKCYFQKFDDMECLNTPQYSVMADTADKEIVYAPKKGDFEIKDPSLGLNLDSVLMFCKSTQFKKISDDLCCYNLKMLDAFPDYNEIAVYFNPKTFLIRKLIFFCEEDDISIDNQDTKMAKARVEITYNDINLKPTLPQSDFTFEKYLVKAGGKFHVNPSYKGYHLTVLSF